MAKTPYRAFLLVDGYNIIGDWSCLKRTRDLHGLQFARQELIEALINYTAHQGFKTEVVFDAHYQNTPSNRESYHPALSVYYTAFAQTADTYIEKVCANCHHNKCNSCQRIIVATSDRAQKLTVIGYGAEWLSAKQLQAEIDLIQRQVRRKSRPQKKSQGRFLVNSLDAKSKERLAQWRLGIY